MAYIPDKEKERAQELMRRYNNPMPLEDLLAYVSSIYAEGRADERRECLKCANEVQLNAIKSQRLEVGKSQSGMDFQSGRRNGADEVMAKITARSALQITQDNLANSYPETDEVAQAVAAEIEAVPVPEPAPEIELEIEEIGFKDEIEFDPESEAEIIEEMQIDVPDLDEDGSGAIDEEAEDESDDYDEDDDEEEEPILPEPKKVVITQKRPKSKRPAAKKAKPKPKARPRR